MCWDKLFELTVEKILAEIGDNPVTISEEVVRRKIRNRRRK